MNVPFAFETGSKHYAAGVYTISMNDEHTLLLRGVSDSGLAMTSIEDNGQRAQKGVAVFHKYGDQYFLSEISVTGRSRRIYLRPSTAESKLQIAQRKTAPQSVEVAVLQELPGRAVKQTRMGRSNPCCRELLPAHHAASVCSVASETGQRLSTGP